MKNSAGKLECCRCQHPATIEQGHLDFNLDGVWIFTCAKCRQKELQHDKKNQEISMDCKTVSPNGGNGTSNNT